MPIVKWLLWLWIGNKVRKGLLDAFLASNHDLVQWALPEATMSKTRKSVGNIMDRIISRGVVLSPTSWNRGTLLPPHVLLRAVLEVVDELRTEPEQELARGLGDFLMNAWYDEHGFQPCAQRDPACKRERVAAGPRIASSTASIMVIVAVALLLYTLAVVRARQHDDPETQRVILPRNPLPHEETTSPPIMSNDSRETLKPNPTEYAVDLLTGFLLDRDTFPERNSVDLFARAHRWEEVDSEITQLFNAKTAYIYTYREFNSFVGHDGSNEAISVAVCGAFDRNAALNRARQVFSLTPIGDLTEFGQRTEIYRISTGGRYIGALSVMTSVSDAAPGIGSVGFVSARKLSEAGINP